MRWSTLALILAALFAVTGCDESGIVDDDDVADDDVADDDVADDDVADDDVADDDVADDDVADDDVADDDVADDDVADDDVADDDVADDDVADDDVGDDDTSAVDADGDGWDETVDCDDNDPALNLDDADNDGYDSCNGDCNDGNGAINPLATDVVGDGIDQNCDGIDGVDMDDDGYAADWSGGDDCDDADAAINPGAVEACDGLDNDCDGSLPADEADADGDGYGECEGDCDDADDTSYPNAAELCDGVDNNCNGVVPADELDADNDGFAECEDDCDDADPDANPDAEEVCGNGADDDCDGVTDETCYTDTYTQAGNMEVDVLWVVDNSCSMYEEQGYLSYFADSFFDAMAALGVDFHVAVVTTDTATFFGSTPVMDNSTPNLLDEFDDAVSVGTSGSGTEQGLLYGSLAVTPPLSDPGEANDGFLRERAGLRVVYLSDEDDQSPGSTSGYVDLVAGLMVNPDHLVLSGITGQISGCASAYTAPEYEDAIALTGGVSESICDSDWSTPLENIGNTAEHYADTFPLTATPDETTIQVFVNGVQVTSGWSYDATLQAVIFDWTDVPDNGDAVEIQYTL